MADDAGQPRADLGPASKAGAPDLTKMGFFELLRRLETDELRLGRAGGPSREPARLGQRARLTFATRDVAGLRISQEGPPQVDVEVLGLFGPEGPMPLHLTRWIMERLSDRWFDSAKDRETADSTFLDFANMLQHRLLALYWRAWADAHPEVQIEHGPEGRVRSLLDALSGIGLPGLHSDGGESQDDRLMRRHATDLAQHVHGVERLTRLIADLLAAPVVLREFVGEWIAIPEPLQTRIGGSHARLGQSAVAGRRTFQRQSRTELQVGPLTLTAYERLLDDPALRQRLARTIVFAVGREIDYDLRLILAQEEVPAIVLGRDGPGRARLGLTAWLGGARDRDARDLRLYSVTDTSRTAA